MIDNKTKKSNSLDDLEFLFQETERQSELGIGLDIDEELVKNAQLIEDGELHDQQKAHTLFYTIQKIIIKRIPKGAGRDLILQQKTLYLNKGKSPNKSGITGIDSRMSHNAPFSTMLELVYGWANEYPNDNGIKLLTLLVELNEKAGYKVEMKGLGENFNENMKEIAKQAKTQKQE